MAGERILEGRIEGGGSPWWHQGFSLNKCISHCVDVLLTFPDCRPAMEDCLKGVCLVQWQTFPASLWYVLSLLMPLVLLWYSIFAFSVFLREFFSFPFLHFLDFMSQVLLHLHFRPFPPLIFLSWFFSLAFRVFWISPFLQVCFHIAYTSSSKFFDTMHTHHYVCPILCTFLHILTTYVHLITPVNRSKDLTTPLKTLPTFPPPLHTVHQTNPINLIPGPPTIRSI